MEEPFVFAFSCTSRASPIIGPWLVRARSLKIPWFRRVSSQLLIYRNSCQCKEWQKFSDVYHHCFSGLPHCIRLNPSWIVWTCPICSTSLIYSCKAIFQSIKIILSHWPLFLLVTNKMVTVDGCVAQAYFTYTSMLF